MLMQTKTLTSLAFAVAVLAACGGGGDDEASAPPDDGGTQPPAAQTKAVSGVIVVPESISGSTSRAAVSASTSTASRATILADAACTGVPVSYQPLANATIRFLDAQGKEMGTAVVTDACGAFSTDVPLDVTTATATADSYRTITTSIDLFESGGSDPVLSTLPDVDGAGYRISSLQWQQGKFYFTVADTLTGKAVLGVPATAIRFNIGTASPRELAGLSYAATQLGEASIALALDASGSMSSAVIDPSSGQYVLDDQGRIVTMLRMAAKAAHIFVDGKRAGDELGYVVFDDRVNWFDTAIFGNTIRLTSGTSGSAYDPAYPQDGFVRDGANLRLPIDLFNDHSKLYGNTQLDAIHPSLPQDLKVTSSYLWGGSTAAYDAAQIALEKLSPRPTARKFGILMTDGDDNYSDTSIDDLISSYQASGIPLWTVSFGASTSTKVLDKIASETGGSYVDATDPTRLAAEFAALQTGIVYQYIGDPALSASEQAGVVGQDVTVTLDYSGATASRAITVPAP